MILDVPLIRQEEKSVNCGLAGLAMLFKYYNVDVSYEDIKKEVEVDKLGTYGPQMGTYLIKKGFDVEIITLHPGLFTKKDESMKREEILDRMKSLYGKSNKEQDKKVLNYFIEFVEAGGKVKVKIPNKDDVIEEIGNKRPIFVLMTSNFLKGDKPKFNFHFNIITGIDDKFIYANDPLWDERGGKHKHLIEDFFYGIYSSAYYDLDNASFLKIKKRA